MHNSVHIFLPTFSTGTILGTYFVLSTIAPCTIFCPRCLSGTIIRSTVGRLRASGTSLPGYGKDRIMTQRSSTLSEIEPPELGNMKIIVETRPAFSELSERAFLDPDFAELLVKNHRSCKIPLISTSLFWPRLCWNTLQKTLATVRSGGSQRAFFNPEFAELLLKNNRNCKIPVISTSLVWPRLCWIS